MTIYNTRWLNANDIAKRVGGQSKFAQRMDMERQQANHILGPKRVKNIGERLARKIETTFSMPHGWLDQDHSAKTPLGSDPDWIEVPLLSALIGERSQGDVAAAMRLSREWVRANVSVSAFDHMALVTSHGDAMSPTFDDNAVLVVDRAVTSVESNAVYVFIAGDTLQVRRVQRNLDGSLTVLCDNARYASERIEAKDRAKLMIVARVVTAFVPAKV